MRVLIIAAALLSFSAPVLAKAPPAHATKPAPRPIALPADVAPEPNKDWANIARYRGANAVLMAEPASADRVVFMGDSITQLWVDQPYLKGSKTFVGRGIAGQTASQMVLRFRGDVIDLKPAVVHIMAGTNDVAQNNGPESLEEIEGYIVSMVELAQANRIKVVLASIPPASEFAWHKGLEPAPKIAVINQWLKAYAARLGLPYADYWAVLATPEGAMKPEYSADGVHPNAAGYDAMRPVAEAAIAAALQR
ncbi:MAG: GDSL-type esterase/lipase family protein [Novosphingobium sp.]